MAWARPALFYGTLGTVVCVLVMRGLADGGLFGAAELAAGLATTLLTFAVMRAEAEGGGVGVERAAGS
jgi:hypothetical protein